MVAEADGPRARVPLVIWAAGFALGWFLCRQLALEWRINPQYSYGWVVPPLALYLWMERWRDRPEVGSVSARGWLFAGLLFLFLPLRLTQEANPDWRLASWVGCVLVVGIFWCALAAVGGRAWWRHFAFATAFIIVAAPWPTPIENILVQSLMRAVAAVGSEFLNWMGIAAHHDGNLIRLAGGTLGVDEACSGVRSFQATIMTALFLGEVNRLTWRRRIGLLLIGVIVALGFNLVRAILLAWLAAKRGVDIVNSWHDPAGYLLLAVTFVTLLTITKFLGSRNVTVPAVVTSAPKWPLRAAWCVIIWLEVCDFATAMWYRTNERTQVAQTRWRADWPADAAEVKILENIRPVLRFNEGKAAIWERPDGSRWHLFFFVWKPGRAAANLARTHRPETCLPATGFEFVENRGVKVMRAGGLDLPVERIEFEKAGQRLHVYYCLWEDRASKGANEAEPLTRENRVRAVLEGRRHSGQRALEVVIAGMDSAERADAALAEELDRWVKVQR